MSAVHRIAGRYAKSLIDLAQERGRLEEVTRDLQHFKSSLANRDLQLLLASPIVNTTKKLAAMKALFGGYDEITTAFLRIVTEKRREAALPAIADEYLERYRKQQGISKVRLTSATPYDPATVESIRAKLQAAGLVTNRVEFEHRVDPELLGGFVVEVGDRLYDTSARAQLKNLRKAFTGNPYQKAMR